MPAILRKKLKFPTRDRGAALVIVLSIVVLISLLVIAFLSKSSLNSQANNSFTSGISADLLATDAANTIIGGLQAEIHSGSNSMLYTSGSTTIYLPKSGSNTIPQMDANAFSLYQKTYTTTGNNSTLIRSSAYSDGQSSASLPGDLQSLVSKVSGSTPSINGRIIPLSRWNTPQLLTSAVDTQSTCPSWIYVNPSGPVQLTGWSSALTSSTNSQYVLGRFAYRAYDISGLLDMNAAGYPSKEVDDIRIGRKGTLAMADFYSTAIPGFSPQGGNNALLNWRDPSTVTYSTGTNPFFLIDGSLPYDSYVNEFGQKYGFMSIPPASYSDTDAYLASGSGGTVNLSFGTMDRFLDRSDLINFTKINANTGEFTGSSADFLSGVTSFTRECNSPSWGGTDTWRNASLPLPQVEATMGINPNLSTVLITGPGFTRNDGTQAVPGQPLVKSRFPLSKIALLSTPSNAAPNTNSVAIKEYFGLVFVPAGVDNGSGFGSRSFDHWEYQGGTRLDTFPDGTTRERLHTLTEVAALGREPNFFELLQAGINTDSVGQAACTFDVNGKSRSTTAGQWTNQDIARHILQIGVNIIDQYDTDSIPTVIARTRFEDLSINLKTPQMDPDICGVENLPYIQIVSTSRFRRFDKVDMVGIPGGITYNGKISTAAGSGTTTLQVYPCIATYYQFQLWNPHANVGVSSGTFLIQACSNTDSIINPFLQVTATDSNVVVNGALVASLPVNGVYGPESDRDGDTGVSSITGGYQVFTGTSGTSPHSFQFQVPLSGGQTFSIPHLLQLDDALGSVSANCKFDAAVPPSVSPIVISSTLPAVTLSSHAHILGFWAGDAYAPYNGYTAATTPSGTTQQNHAYPQILEYSTLYPSGLMTIDNGADVRFQLLVKSASGQWVPLQTVGPLYYYPGDNMNQPQLLLDGQGGSSYGFYADPPDIGPYYMHPDPRTMRFGLNLGKTEYGYFFNVFARPEITPYKVVDPNSGQPAVPEQISLTGEVLLGSLYGWVPTDLGSLPLSGNGVSTSGDRNIKPDELAANKIGTNKVDTWYADRGSSTAGGIVRVGDREPQNADPYTTPSARPYILNRPFRSVAEMGYAFRDLPWKSLNFSQDQGASASQPTADAALLDLFSVDEAPVRAGTINLNAASAPALTALLQKTNINPSILATSASGTNDGIAAISSVDAQSLAQQILTYLGPRNASNNVLQTAGDLTNMIQSGKLGLLSTWTKEQREALIAALGDVHNARTWNVLIDVYAQSGRFPSVDVGALDKFQVTGQKHLWIEVAIDRYTGKIVDQIMEQPDSENSAQ